MEEEGIPTTQISLVREHTAAIRPPRALWVPFILGRPLGVPGDPAFQRRVLRAALSLFDATSGPVLEDYAEEVPVTDQPEEDGSVFACPVNFSRPVEAEGLAGELLREVAALAPWYELAVSRRRRTTATLSGLGPAEMARFLAGFIADPTTTSYRDDVPLPLALRLVTQDLKAYYLEAAAVQPGARVALEAREWFWRSTGAGQAFLRLRDVCLAHPDDTVKGFGARSLVPLAIAPRPAGADALRRY
ncbi:MAG: hypothetical protein H7125_10735 [Proteobacteria bacterium]|nr:hypothetical protein [Burkholderiales bacterium]